VRESRTLGGKRGKDGNLKEISSAQRDQPEKPPKLGFMFKSRGKKNTNGQQVGAGHQEIKSMDITPERGEEKRVLISVRNR